MICLEINDDLLSVASFICVTWLMYTCDMMRSYLTWLIRLWHDSFVCHVTHSIIWYASFMCDMTLSYVTSLIQTWNMTDSSRRYDSLISDMTHSHVTWLIHMLHDSSICDMPYSYMSHDSLICDMTHLFAGDGLYYCIPGPFDLFPLFFLNTLVLIERLAAP